MATAVFILTAYLIGSLSFAVIVSRAFSLPDPRTYGSGNPGATNVLRTGKKLAALLTLIGDGGKGWLAVFLSARYAAGYGVDATGVAACAVAVFLGHVFPVFFRFRGGKGVSTAGRSEEHTSELQSRSDLVCRLLLEKKKKPTKPKSTTAHPQHA